MRLPIRLATSTSTPLCRNMTNIPPTSALSTSPAASPSTSPSLDAKHRFVYPSIPPPSTKLKPRATSFDIERPRDLAGEGAGHRPSFDFDAVRLPSFGMVTAGSAAGGHLASVSGPSKNEHVLTRFKSPDPDNSDHTDLLRALSPKRREVVDDCLALFNGKATLERLERTWRKDAVFVDPLTRCKGFAEYAPQWFGMPKAFSHFETLSFHLLPGQNERELRWEQHQEYTVRGLGTKKIIHSLVIVTLDEHDQITHFEDRWDGKEVVDKWGTGMLRRINARVMPWMIGVPKTDG